MSAPAAPAAVVVASAPGRLRLCGGEAGPQLSVAVDRRALCRVEMGTAGVELEAKDALVRSSAPDVDGLLLAAPGSLAAQALGLLGASGGLRVVTEWKLPAGSGVDGEAALALAATAAVAGMLGRTPSPEQLVELAGEVARRAGRACAHGLHAALWGGAVLTHARPGGLEAERLAMDPGRVEESLLLVDVADAAGAAPGAVTPPDDASRALPVAEALAGGRYEEVVALLDQDPDEAPAGTPQARVVALVRAAGGAARPLGGRLVAVWAPPGARGPGRREAVAAALKAAGERLLPVRVDLRGLELD